MSRIGKQEIVVPAGVSVEIKENEVKVIGPLGTLKRTFNPLISFEQADGKITVKLNSELNEHRGLHGLSRTLLSNMIQGVDKGYEKRLEVIGVGYKFKPSGNRITLNLGFSHPIEYKAPEGIKFEEDKENKALIVIKGYDKEALGEVAAKIRSFRPPEPYKGKGIRYFGERIVKKAGKSAVTSGAPGAAK